MIDGGPSVLFDAVALILSEEGAERLTGEAAARDFVADAFAHCKFIAFMPLLHRCLSRQEFRSMQMKVSSRCTTRESIVSFVESSRELPPLGPRDGGEVLKERARGNQRSKSQPTDRTGASLNRVACGLSGQNARRLLWKFCGPKSPK